MDRRVILYLLANDLRLLLRSGRVLFLSVVLPLLLFPVILLISNVAQERREARLETALYRYALAGSEVEQARSWLGEVDRRLATVKARDFHFEEIEVADPERALAEDAVDFFVVAVREAEVPRLEIHFRSDRDDSANAGARIQRELEKSRRAAWESRLQEAGFPIRPEDLLATEIEDVATPEQSSGLLLGRFLSALFVFLLISGGSVVALDSLAGEKERGTLETLLTTAASRLELVAAKSLSVLVVALVITAINVVNVLIWIGLEVIPLPEGFASPVNGITLLLLFLLLLPLAGLISSLLLLISGYSRTYKEAQLLLFPVTLICVAPTLVAALPGLDVRSGLALVPVAGLALATKEVLSGAYLGPMILVAWLSTAAAALLVGRQSLRALSSERLVSAMDFDAAAFLGGRYLFPRHVLRWYALLWALFLLVQLAFGPPRTDLRLVLIVNMGLFLVASLLMIRVYDLDPRQALALRWPRRQVWFALLLGVPAAAVLTVGVGELGGLFFPMPESWQELMRKALMPEEIPGWQLVPLLTLLPGICEEIAFRGVLLYGLRRRLRPLSLVLVVGLIFGLFHVDLFRILPTAFLGSLLAAVTLLTASLLPAVLWHMAHNGLTLLFAEELGESAGLFRWLYAPAALLLALALLLLWRTRVPTSLTETTGSPRAPDDGPP